MELLKELMRNKPVLYVPMGASGSGKSTFLKKLRAENPDLTIDSFSFDDLRHQWYDQENYARAFKLSADDKDFNDKAYAVFRQMIKRGNDIYVDNTNLTVKRRKFYIDIARRAGYRVIGIEMPVDLETIIARQQTRGDKNVKADVVRDQYTRLQRPAEGEFDEVIVSNHNLKNK